MQTGILTFTLSVQSINHCYGRKFVGIIAVTHMLVVFMFVLFFQSFLSGFRLIILMILEYANFGFLFI